MKPCRTPLDCNLFQGRQKAFSGTLQNGLFLGPAIKKEAVDMLEIILLVQVCNLREVSREIFDPDGMDFLNVYPDGSAPGYGQYNDLSRMGNIEFRPSREERFSIGGEFQGMKILQPAIVRRHPQGSPQEQFAEKGCLPVLPSLIASYRCPNSGGHHGDILLLKTCGNGTSRMGKIDLQAIS